MEEAPVTAATGALGPVIAKLAALLGSEYKLSWRTRRDVKFIKSKLKPVHSILWNIWEREELDAASMALKMEALDLADDVDDAIHDFMMKMERSRSKKRLAHTKIKASHFKDFKKRSSDVSGRCHSKWKEKEKPASDDSSPAGKPRAYPFVRKDASELVDQTWSKVRLIEHLVEKHETTPVELQLKTATIVGTAGVGKTTLADLVYQAIGHEFQSRAFLSVARPGGYMREVLARILQQVAPDIGVPFAGTQAATEEDLIDIISNFLKDKRYLVVIDDIWNWREWEIIRKSLPENNLGSRIVRTTRILAIANKWRLDPYELHQEILHDHNTMEDWVYKITTEMLAMNANLVGEGFDHEHPIVDMCGGTPLALLCMLSAVAQEREKQGHHANTCDVQDEIEKQVMANGIQNTPGFEPLVESLQLGYDDLPHYMLKTCLLYCSIYPDGHNFDKHTLVRRWISERFVYTEEEGNSYFEELLNRGLILCWTTDYADNLRIHPMMRIFLQWKSRQDNFIICSSEITPSCRIRRLCICDSPRRSRDATEDPLSAMDWYHIRSLVVSEGIERVPFEKLEGLRVLDLCWIQILPDHQLKHVCGLVRLRHLLGLKIGELPAEIVSLQCLETLETKGNWLAPGLDSSFIRNMQQLKTLELRGEETTQLPREIGELQQLHTLRIRGTNIAELPKEIEELQQLKILDISHTEITVLPKEIGELHQLEHLLMDGTKVAKIRREVGALKQLKTFSLDRCYTKSALPLEVCAWVELPESIRQPMNKSGLVSELAKEMLSFQNSLLVGGLVVGAKQMHIPLWIREHFNDVGLLDIRMCKLEEGGLKILRGMPQLVELRLRFEVVPREAVVISSQGFAKLESLTIDSRVPRVTFKEGAMPKLRDLTFLFQFYAGPPNKDPVGINHLRELCTIKFKCKKDWYGGGDSPCIRPTIDVMKKEAQGIPYLAYFGVCGRYEEIHSPPPSPPPLEMGQRSEMEQGETEEEEERSSGESEIEEEDI